MPYSMKGREMKQTRLFECRIDWQGDTFVRDAYDALNEIGNNVPRVLNVMGSEMIHDLQTHINKDVYAAYKPSSYPRRKDNPQYGTPLDDLKNFTTRIHSTDVGIMEYQSTLEFDYHPDGTHTGKRKDTLDYDAKLSANRGMSGDDSLKPNPVHNDVLINRLQTGRGYDWVPKDKIPPRPFWSNFVDEEIQSGGIKRRFDRISQGMHYTRFDYTYKTQFGKSDFIWDGTDGALSTDATWNDDEDDLPF